MGFSVASAPALARCTLPAVSMYTTSPAVIVPPAGSDLGGRMICTGLTCAAVMVKLAIIAFPSLCVCVCGLDQPLHVPGGRRFLRPQHGLAHCRRAHRPRRSANGRRPLVLRRGGR